MTLLLMLCCAVAPPGGYVKALPLEMPGDRPLEIRAMAFARDSRQLIVAGGWQGETKGGGGMIWHLAARPRPVRYEINEKERLNLYQVVPLPERRFVTCTGSEALVWDTEGKLQRSFPAEISRNAERFGLVRDRDLWAPDWSEFHIFDVEAGKKRETRKVRVSRPTVFNPDGRSYATLQYQDVDLWDATTGRLIRTFADHEGIVNLAGFSPDGKQLITAFPIGSDDSPRTRLTVWEVTTARKKQEVVIPGVVLSLALFPEAQQVAIAQHGSLLIVDLRTGGELAHINYTSMEVRVSADGRWLAARNLSQVRLFQLYPSRIQK